MENADHMSDERNSYLRVSFAEYKVEAVGHEAG